MEKRYTVKAGISLFETYDNLYKRTLDYFVNEEDAKRESETLNDRYEMTLSQIKHNNFIGVENGDIRGL